MDLPAPLSLANGSSLGYEVECAWQRERKSDGELEE